MRVVEVYLDGIKQQSQRTFLKKELVLMLRTQVGNNLTLMEGPVYRKKSHECFNEFPVTRHKIHLVNLHLF